MNQIDKILPSKEEVDELLKGKIKYPCIMESKTFGAIVYFKSEGNGICIDHEDGCFYNLYENYESLEMVNFQEVNTK